MKLLIITLLLMLMAGGGGVLVFHRISALMEQNAKMSQDLHAKDAKISTFESILNKFQMPAQPKLEKTPEPIHQESTMPTPAQE